MRLLPDLRIPIPDVLDMQQTVLRGFAEVEAHTEHEMPREFVDDVLRWAQEQHLAWAAWRRRRWHQRLMLAFSVSATALISALSVAWWVVAAWLLVVVLHAHALGKELARGPLVFPFHGGFFAEIEDDE